MISSGRRTALNYRILRNPVAAALWRRAWQHARGDTIEGINLPASREEMVAEILSVFSPPPFP